MSYLITVTETIEYTQVIAGPPPGGQAQEDSEGARGGTGASLRRS